MFQIKDALNLCDLNGSTTNIDASNLHTLRQSESPEVSEELAAISTDFHLQDLQYIGVPPIDVSKALILSNVQVFTGQNGSPHVALS